MEQSIYSGNARNDGADFNGWFIGSLGDWCAQNGITRPPGGIALRDTGQLEVKWGSHLAGQLRPGGWAGCTDKYCLSLMVRGDFTWKFRSPQDPEREVAYRLVSEGDYLLWREQVEHTWQAQADSVILTVRWKAG